MNRVILLSRRKKQKALEAVPSRAAWEAVLEGAPALQGRKEGGSHREGGDASTGGTSLTAGGI